MKNLLLPLLLLGLLTDCTYRPKEKRLTKFKNEHSQILESFYKKTNDTIEFKRILTDGATSKIQSGYIFLDDNTLTHQKFSSVQQLTNANIFDSLKTQFKADGFAEKLFDDRDVMFVQIVPDSAMDEEDASGFINLRHNIEEEIDARLKTNNLGEWFAGDMGAGANMLFFVDDWTPAMEIVMEVLREENLLDHVLITKRIATAKNEWNYEIVYPTEYEGIFNEI
ncbi:hypothetical protein ACFQ21_17920 [Ohtaekwangia kribbensis]|jgi:hypothetical protein|uniref:Lipoprotein n=1 Tax=Ohtaekwangia kribbensis TaxID=688913 RepID=A0ABW3K5X0_9BACT